MPSREDYGKFLEPGSFEGFGADHHALLYSIAVSLKRLADAWGKGNIPPLDDDIPF